MFTGTNTFEDAESKSKELPLRKPAVFSQTAILCSLILRQFFFIVKRHAWMKTRGCITQMTNLCEPVSTFNKRLFCFNHFESCNLMRAGHKQHILSTALRRHR